MLISRGGDGVDRLAKAQLYRATDLAAVAPRRHNGAKRTDIVEVVAHELRDLALVLDLLGQLLVDGLKPIVHIRHVVAVVERHALLDVDLVSKPPLLNVRGVNGLVFDEVNVVTDLALDAHVGDDAATGLGIDAREVPGIRITIGIAVLHVAEEHEVIAILDGLGHGYSSSARLLEPSALVESMAPAEFSFSLFSHRAQRSW